MLDGAIREAVSAAIAESGLSHQDIANRLTELGWPVNKTRVRLMATGERGISASELLLIALALGIPVADLLAPDDVEIRSETVSRDQLRDWIQGLAPLPVMFDRQAWADAVGLHVRGFSDQLRSFADTFDRSPDEARNGLAFWIADYLLGALKDQQPQVFRAVRRARRRTS